MKTRTLLAITLIYIQFVLNIHAQDLGCDFTTDDYRNDLAGFGDSRAWGIDSKNDVKNTAQPEPDITRDRGNAISIATNPPESKNKILGLDLKVISRSSPGKTTEYFFDKINDCKKHSKPLAVPAHTFINLGGNDVINILVRKEELLLEYQSLQFKKIAEDLQKVVMIILRQNFLLAQRYTIQQVLNKGLMNLSKLVQSYTTFATNPVWGAVVKVLSNRQTQEFLSTIPAIGSFLQDPNAVATLYNLGAPLMSYHAYWQWRTDIEVDKIIFNMDYIARHLLEQGNNTHSILINTIAPPALPKLDQMDQDTKNGITLGNSEVINSVKRVRTVSENYADAVSLMLRVNLKYLSSLTPSLWGSYGIKRVLYVDSTSAFWQNIQNNHGNYYVWDGIHYTEAGNLEWGRIMAKAMAQWEWYDRGPGYLVPPDPKFYSDIDVNSSHVNTMIRALYENVPVDAVINRGLQFQNTAFKKEFSEIGSNYYTKPNESIVYSLRGNMLHKYRQMDEANGQLGAPMTEEFCWGPIPTCPTRIAFFEKGFILDDVQGGTNPVVNV